MRRILGRLGKKRRESRRELRNEVLISVREPCLFDVIKRGDLRELNLLLQGGEGVNATDSQGNTPLIYAAQCGNVDAIKILIESGANENVRDNTGKKALDYMKRLRGETRDLALAVYNSTIEAREQAIRARGHASPSSVAVIGGLDSNVTRNKINSDLIEAARNGWENKIRSLVREGAEVNAVDADGCTALMFAAYEGHVGAVGVLLRRGANVNFTAHKKGMTPLMAAATKSRLDIIELLVKHGAKIDSVDKRNAGVLMYAARKNCIYTVHALVSLGGDVDLPNINGLTPLMQAGNRGNAAVIRTLVGLGANIDSVDNNGVTTLMEAAFHGHADAVSTLIELGADETIINNKGKTALDYIKMLRGDKRDLVCAVYDSAIEAKKQSVRVESNEQVYREAARPTNFERLPPPPSRGRYDSTKAKKQSVRVESSEQVYREAARPANFERPPPPPSRGRYDSLYLVEGQGDSPSTQPSICVDRDVSLLDDSSSDSSSLDSSDSISLDSSDSSGFENYLAYCDLDDASYEERGSARLNYFIVLKELGALEISSFIRGVKDMAARQKTTFNFNFTEALVFAILIKNESIVQVLLENGADFNSHDYILRTTLMVAIDHADVENIANVINDLVERGADVNLNTGNTALIYAVRRGNLEAMSALIKAGADENMRDCFDSTALDIITRMEPKGGKLKDAYDAAIVERSRSSTFSYNSMLEKGETSPSAQSTSVDRARRVLRSGRRPRKPLPTPPVESSEVGLSPQEVDRRDKGKSDVADNSDVKAKGSASNIQRIRRKPLPRPPGQSANISSLIAKKAESQHQGFGKQ